MRLKNILFATAFVVSPFFAQASTTQESPYSLSKRMASLGIKFSVSALSPALAGQVSTIQYGIKGRQRDSFMPTKRDGIEGGLNFDINGVTVGGAISLNSYPGLSFSDRTFRLYGIYAF